MCRRALNVLTVVRLIAVLNGHGRTTTAHSTIQQAVDRARHRMAKRDKLVGKVAQTGLWPSMASLDFSSFYGGAVIGQAPFDCPVGLTKTRSANHDGGKWMCGLELVGKSQPCVVYSLGSNFDTSFEEDVQDTVVLGGRRGGCSLHIYDPTLRGRNETGHADLSGERLRRFRMRLKAQSIGTLHEIAFSHNTDTVTMRIESLGTRTYPAMSLQRMLAANGHQHTCIDVLKVDVEGAEGAMLAATRWSELCIGMIVVELHSRLIEDYQRTRQQEQQHDSKQLRAPVITATDGGRADKGNGIPNPSGQPLGTAQQRRAFHAKHPFRVADAISLVHRLESAGFMHYSSELVCAWCPGQMELGFVNVSWLRVMTQRG